MDVRTRIPGVQKSGPILAPDALLAEWNMQLTKQTADNKIYMRSVQQKLYSLEK